MLAKFSYSNHHTIIDLSVLYNLSKQLDQNHSKRIKRMSMLLLRSPNARSFRVSGKKRSESTRLHHLHLIYDSVLIYYLDFIAPFHIS